VIFEDRRDAGLKLAADLRLGLTDHSVLFGLPRGGVIVAAAAASVLGCPFEVYIVRKLRAPVNDEFAMGALAEDGPPLVDEATARSLAITPAYIEREVAARRADIDRYRSLYRNDASLGSLGATHAIIVDDGVATGATVEAAVDGLRARGCRSVGIAAPVASESAVNRLRPLCDDMTILSVPRDFFAVGHYYRQFGQTTDEEVVRALRSGQGA